MHKKVCKYIYTYIIHEQVKQLEPNEIEFLEQGVEKFKVAIDFKVDPCGLYQFFNDANAFNRSFTFFKGYLSTITSI